MSLNRRKFLNLLAGTAAAGIFVSLPLRHSSLFKKNPETILNNDVKIKALVFDAFPIFDPRPVFSLAEELFPGNGKELSNLWRTRQFEYQWLRVLSDNYVNFWTATNDALLFACKSLKLEPAEEKRERLMNAYLKLKPWEDVPETLNSLKDAGLRLGFLSNMTYNMLETNVNNSGLSDVFDILLSTDEIKTYKPDPKAYKMGMDAFGLQKSEVGFVAFAGWDAAGAKTFGYPTFWNNRIAAQLEELGVVPDEISSDFSALMNFSIK